MCVFGLGLWTVRKLWYMDTFVGGQVGHPGIVPGNRGTRDTHTHCEEQVGHPGIVPVSLHNCGTQDTQDTRLCT